MNTNFKTRFSNFLKRDWIQKNEGKLTYVQLFGFLLIACGVVYLASYLLPSGVIHAFPALDLDEEPTPNGISIAFFTTMLGVAFAFPGMLRGQTKEISTMRIIVFMFANVICMLLLKIGWNKGSLQEIGLDGYWMGVIAFLFGAKATQSYFENAKSLLPGSKQASGNTESTLSPSEVSRLATIQNRDELLAKHPNIECVSDTLKNGNSAVTLYVKDDNTDTLPKELSATLKNGSVINVPTEIIAGSGEAKPHIGQATDELSDSNSPNYFGSACCIVESTTNPNFRGIITSGHVFTYGDFINYGGVVSQTQSRNGLLNGNPVTKLFFQQMLSDQDLAITEVTDKANLPTDYMSFSKGFYQVSQTDFHTASPNVTIASRQNNIRDAYILDFNVSFEIKYFNTPRYVRNIILIGSTNDRATSSSVSSGGDSGSCVYHKETGKLIGMLLGGNTKFSFVLPLEETLNSFNFKLS
jgi:hypothetical protein